MRRTFLIFFALLLAIAAPAAAQYTADSAIVIRRFDAELAVQPSGTVEVTEVIRFAFTGRWRGILRDLSLQHRTAQGEKRKLDIELIGATDEVGNPLEWEEDDAPDSWTRRMRIWIPGAQNAERTILIRYRVHDAIRFYFARDSTPAAARRWAWCRWERCPPRQAVPGHPAFDELYWNATGNQWDMPIEQARVLMVLPRGVRPLQWAAYTGATGDRTRGADVIADSARGIVTFTLRQSLGAREGMTVAAGWAPGAIAGRPSPTEIRRARAVRMWPLALPLLVFALALRTWRRRGRDPRARAIVVAYEPPDGITPAEAGTLVDHVAQIRDIVSTVTDLAVRGYVGIEEREEKKLLGLLSSTDYVFHQRRPASEWSSLLAHEERFLAGLFSGTAGSAAPWDAVRATYAEARRAHDAGREMDADEIALRLAGNEGRGTASVRLSDLRNQFYRSIPGIRDGIYESLVRRGYYLHRPDKVKANWVGLAFAVLIVGVVAAGFASEEAFAWMAAWTLAVGSVASALVLFIFALVMPARTQAGARAREAALGFREFLSRVESDRYRRMVTSPEMFERYLPYAMAFGVEDRWAAAFDDLYSEPPDWYSGGGYDGFRASGFTSRMSSMSSSAGSTMSSSPSSSGSGGGGSSGGGSGGGGGSGF
ncbi:DUF2207 domain-containing protein [Longimicrobium sp.]|uniref:DUF2207 domain-containing protein n=1 Tax=Longimicrobium sp. TaxID=2029185 RepID=UPI002E2F45DE|nr:DUF2207 domain-containing protein [Longimicrobium sp.]HEX6039456.1 DUF2207 domain-containing protein [Longimicrobium sp.]